MSPKSARKFEPDDRIGKLSVNVIDEQNGLKVIRNVRSIRIRDKEYVLLIMEDYSATIGEIDGDVAILTTEDEIRLEGIRGFYRLSSNEMTLILRS